MRSIVIALLLSGCASAPMLCSTPTDMTGRGIALCHVTTQTPVCDTPGMMASYQPNALGGYTLTGGTRAMCDSSNQVVCADRTIAPHCLEQPASH